MADLPAPLTPADSDLRDFPFMPLDVVRLRDSDISAVSTGDEFRCAVLLWCASWHQVPAASLPDDDIILSQLAGFGRVVKEWKKVREGALRNWVKCSDGRLYHPVVSEKANEAWDGRVKYREKKEAERIRKAEERRLKKLAEEGGQAPERPEDKEDLSEGQKPPVQQTSAGSPPENALTVDSGQWIGTVDSGQLTSKPQPSLVASTGVGAGQGDGERPQKRTVDIVILLRDKGVKPLTPAHPCAMEWANNPKVTNDLLQAAVQSARDYKPTGDISPNYLKPIVDQLLNPPEPKAKAPQDTWWTSHAGIDRKGREMGMTARPTDNYDSFKDRIFEELRKRGGKAA